MSSKNIFANFGITSQHEESIDVIKGILILNKALEKALEDQKINMVRDTSYSIIEHIRNALLERLSGEWQTSLSGYPLTPAIRSAISWSSNGPMFGQTSIFVILLEEIKVCTSDPYTFMKELNAKWQGLAMLHQTWTDEPEEPVTYIFELLYPEGEPAQSV